MKRLSLLLLFCLLSTQILGQSLSFFPQSSATIHRAAREGDIPKIKELLAKKVDVQLRDRTGRTPLHYAVAAGQKEVAKLLIARGADVKATFPYSYRERDTGNYCYQDYHVFSGTSAPPVVAAASGGNLDIVKLLAGHGAKLTAEHVNRYELLHNVTNMAMAKFLIGLGADVNRKDGHGTTPVGHAAIWKERHDIVGLLLKAGADINIAGKYETPLTAAARMGHGKLVRSFLKHGADPNVMGERYAASPLTACARYGKPEMIKLLLRAGADPNKHPKKSAPALHFAADSGSVESAKLLITAGARIKAITLRDHRTALHVAARFGQIGMAKLLLDKGADIGPRDKSGCTPMHLAGLAGSPSMVAFLLKWGAKADTKSSFGMTTLHFAVSGAILQPDFPYHFARDKCEISKRHMETIKLLAKAGADLNIRSSDGKSPLIYAIEECTSETQDLPITLINLGADVSIPDKKGIKPLALAEKKKLTEVVNLIKSKKKASGTAEQ